VPVIRALAVVLTAWVLVLLAPPGPASAGGPTSALLSVPGHGRTASLSYSDPEYEQLASLVKVGSGTVDDSGRSHDGGTTVTVTWLVHDVEPWRVDRIQLGAEDGPWIATQETGGGATSIWDAPVIWHQPAAGEELIQLLDGLGVGEAGAARGSGAVDGPAAPVEPGPTVPASVEPASAAPAPADDGATSARDRLWWGLGGLAGGVLLAGGWTRLRATRTEHRDEAPDRDDAKDWLEPVPR
jgi:hypothetical protein